jgi:glutathione S-transferase
VPTEPRTLAKYEQAASVEYAQFDPVASGIASEKIFKPHYGQATNEALVTELVARLEIKLNGYEVILGKQKYLAGDVRHARRVSEDDVLLMGSFLLQEVTLADLYHLPYGSVIFENLKLGGLDGRPNIQR